MRRPFEYKEYNVSFVIIALNVIVFFIDYVAPGTRDTLSLVSPAVPAAYGSFGFWQVFTYMFVHANFSHILFNMLGVLFFGVQVEKRIGSIEFALYYLVAGIGAGLFSLAVFAATGTPTILLGASGAVFAVLLAFATLFPYARIYIFGIIPVRAPILVLGYTAVELFSQFFSMRTGVAHLTHLAGFAMGYLYLWARLGLNPIKVFLQNRR